MWNHNLKYKSLHLRVRDPTQSFKGIEKDSVLFSPLVRIQSIGPYPVHWSGLNIIHNPFEQIGLLLLLENFLNEALTVVFVLTHLDSMKDRAEWPIKVSCIRLNKETMG